MKSRSQTVDAIDGYRFIERTETNEYGLERFIEEVYLDDQLIQGRIVNIIDDTSLAIGLGRLPDPPIWASETGIRTQCEEVFWFVDGKWQKYITCWLVFIGDPPPRKIRKISERIMIGDSVIAEESYYADGQVEQRCHYFRNHPVVKKCHRFRPDGTKESETFVKYAEDGTHSEEETRFDENGVKLPGRTKTLYDAQGNLIE